jgi:hypothetical protein
MQYFFIAHCTQIVDFVLLVICFLESVLLAAYEFCARAWIMSWRLGEMMDM